MSETANAIYHAERDAFKSLREEVGLSFVSNASIYQLIRSTNNPTLCGIMLESLTNLT
jgi:hypothetical protein